MFLSISLNKVTAARLIVVGLVVATALGLEKIGQPAGGAVQALQATQAQDSDPGVRAAAAKAIQMITNTQ